MFYAVMYVCVSPGNVPHLWKDLSLAFSALVIQYCSLWIHVNVVLCWRLSLQMTTS